MTDQIQARTLYTNPLPPMKPVKRPGSDSAHMPKSSFHELLQEKVLKLSRHAEQRMQERGIQLRPEQLRKIEDAVDQAQAKGAKESLVVLNDLAFIVSIKNRTIVTALDGSTAKNNVFTQIDSAIIVS